MIHSPQKKLRSENSKLNYPGLMLKRFDLPCLLNHNLHQYLLQSLTHMHLSTHHPDLNNLFTISSLVSLTFNHLHPKNQNLKSKSPSHVLKLLPLRDLFGDLNDGWNCVCVRQYHQGIRTCVWCGKI